MNYVLLAIDLVAIIGFCSAFYNSLKLTRFSSLFSASAAIRSIALFTGVIWCVFLAFNSYAAGNALVEQASASLLAFMGGLYAALIISRSY